MWLKHVPARSHGPVRQPRANRRGVDRRVFREPAQRREQRAQFIAFDRRRQGVLRRRLDARHRVVDVEPGRVNRGLVSFDAVALDQLQGAAKGAVHQVGLDDDVGDPGQDHLLFFNRLHELLRGGPERGQRDLLRVRHQFALFGERRVVFFDVERRPGQQLLLKFLRGGQQRQLALHRALEQHPRNQQPVDLVRAFEDTVDAVVAIYGFDRIAAGEPVAAVNLHRFVGAVSQDFAARDFQDRAFDRVFFDGGEHFGRIVLVNRALAVFDEAGGAVDGRFADVSPRQHLGQLVFDRAEIGYRLSELAALGGVFRGQLQRVFAAADAARAEFEAAEVENVERDQVALAYLAKEPVFRDFAVLQQQRRRRGAALAQLVFFGARSGAVVVVFDDEAGEFFAVDFGEDYIDVGERAVGDPHLLAVQNPMRPFRIESRGGLGRESVGARPGFAQAIGRDPFARPDLRKVFFLLLLRAEINDRQKPDAGRRAEGRGERTLAGDVFRDQHRRNVIERKPAVLLRDARREQPQLARFAQQLALQFVILLFDARAVRRHLFFNVFGGRLRDHSLLFGEILRREDQTRRSIGDQETAAFEDRFLCRNHNPVLSYSSFIANAEHREYREIINSLDAPSVFSVANGLSHQILENARRAHSAADAHCDHSVASLAALHLVKQRGRQFRARAAERVAERDRAAVDVQPFEIEIQLLYDRQSLGGEGLVEFYQIDLFELQARDLQRPRNRDDRADAHLFRGDAGRCERDKSSHRLQSQSLGAFARHHQRRRRAVGSLRRIARSHRAFRVKGGAKFRQSLHRSVAAHAFVNFENGLFDANLAAPLFIHLQIAGRECERDNLFFVPARIDRGRGVAV